MKLDTYYFETWSIEGALTTVIGIFIIYLEPFMMSIDVLASLVNQKTLITCFERLEIIDERMAKENILLNYKTIKKYSIVFLSIAFVGEVTLGIINLIVFQTEFISWQSLWWFLTCVPLFNNSVAKVWFLVLILIVQQRLRAINNYLNDTKKLFFEKKIKSKSVGLNMTKDDLFIENIGYLEKEIFSTRNNKVKDDGWAFMKNSSITHKINDIAVVESKTKNFINIIPYNDPKKGTIK